MEKTHILQAHILDIIFEGRNKSYGAYDLRKTYEARLLKATSFTGLMVLLAIFGTIYASRAGEKPSDLIEFSDTEMGRVKPAEPTPPALPQPPKARPMVPVKQIHFVTPVIVKPEQLTAADKLNDITEDDAIGSSSVETGERATIMAPPVDEKATTVFETPTVNEEEKTFIKVEKDAEFPGGAAAWVRYLQRNLDANTPVNMGAPAGTYKVVVRFIVSKAGVISDVNTTTKHGFGMEEEAIQIIRSGPKWIPALQNGHAVNAYREQSVVFVVEEQ